jgi:hypothetical protein
MSYMGQKAGRKLFWEKMDVQHEKYGRTKI